MRILKIIGALCVGWLVGTVLVILLGMLVTALFTAIGVPANQTKAFRELIEKLAPIFWIAAAIIFYNRGKPKSVEQKVTAEDASTSPPNFPTENPIDMRER